MKSFILFLLVVFLSLPLARAEGPAEAVNCILHVTSVLNTGKTLKKKRRFHVESQEECEDLAEQFRENFAPWRITKKTVRAEWRE